VPTFRFHAGTAGDKLAGPTSFHHVWLGMFTTISHKTSFGSCCKIWICKLGFIYGSCVIVLHHIFFLPFGNSEKHVSSQWIGQRGPTARPSPSPRFNSLRCSSLGTSEVYCLCYKSHWRPELATTNTE
jgi:hypothetical protein